MIRTIGKLGLALGLVALLTGPAMAQGRGRFGGGGGGGGGAMLLSNKGVQQELKVSDEQAAKLDTFAQEMRDKQREEFQKLADLSDEQRREKMQELMRVQMTDLRKGLDNILKPDQVKRFDQIQVQAMGINAFMLPRVQEALTLTDDQRSKIREITEEHNQAMRDVFQGAQTDREAAMQKLTALRKQGTEKAIAVLTDSQKKSWADLIGAPFEVRFEAGPRRGNN